jgi:hypothetical protein
MNDHALLMAYFVEEGTTYFAHGEANATLWTPIRNKSYLYPNNGNRLIRDPFLGRDLSGKFRLLYTEGWWGKAFGHASSDDLIAWGEQKNDNIMSDVSMCKCVWAPEFFCDTIGKDHMVHWTAQIGKVPMIWYAHTKDFFTYTSPRILFNPEFPVIDSTIVKDGNRYVMAFKDESEPVKAIRLAFADSLIGPYKNITRPITPPFTEGPVLFKKGNVWHLYYDKFTQNEWGLMTTENFVVWKEVPIKVPSGARHGSIMEINRRELKKLQAGDRSLMMA